MFIFHCCCIAFYFLFSLICLSSFFNSEPSGNKVSDFIGVLLAIFSISFTVYIIGSTQRRDEKDELVITEKIKRLLNAKEIGDDEIDDEIEK
jgi:hypothetical protein